MTRDERIEALHDFKELAANPAWVRFHGELRKLAEAEAEAHEDAQRTPQERAEHLHSMKLLRELAGDVLGHPGWLATQRVRTEEALRAK